MAGDDLRFIECTQPTRHTCTKDVGQSLRAGKAAIVFHCSIRIRECVNVTVLLPRGRMKFSQHGREAASLLHDVYHLSGWMHKRGLTDISLRSLMFDGIQRQYLDEFVQDLIKLLGNQGGDYILQRNPGTAEQP
jgi:hypothetical protein